MSADQELPRVMLASFLHASFTQNLQQEGAEAIGALNQPYRALSADVKERYYQQAVGILEGLKMSGWVTLRMEHLVEAQAAIAQSTAALVEVEDALSTVTLELLQTRSLAEEYSQLQRLLRSVLEQGEQGRIVAPRGPR